MSANRPRPSTTRSILSATSWALLAVGAMLLVDAGLAAWKCPDPTVVLSAVADGLGWVAIGIMSAVGSGVVARKFLDLRAAVKDAAAPPAPADPPPAGAEG